MLPTDPEGLQALIAQAVQDALGTSIGAVMEEIKTQGGTTEGEDGAVASPTPPPVSGAKQAPDGAWYLADPTRKGKFLKVEPGGTAGGAPQ